MDVDCPLEAAKGNVAPCTEGVGCYREGEVSHDEKSSDVRYEQWNAGIWRRCRDVYVCFLRGKEMLVPGVTRRQLDEETYVAL